VTDERKPFWMGQYKIDKIVVWLALVSWVCFMVADVWRWIAS